MPGIDYRRLRAEVSMPQVLKLIGFQPTSRRGDQLRGKCPLPACRSFAARRFSVHLARGIFQCFACGAAGNQLDLWAVLHDLPLHQAAQSLCHHLDRPIPQLPALNR
jgi:DNA primase